MCNFQQEITTVWSFPQRGNWATHKSRYRGNFAPQIARNLILRYSKEGERVLDPMVGGGTTLIETKLLNRRGIGIFNGKINGDLSNISSIRDFCKELEKGAKELFRVLKENCYCAILIGDTRKNRHYVPLAYKVMQLFLNCGFVLKEDIIKIQHNCDSTPYWQEKSKKLDFLMIMHEHLFVFRKPESNENVKIFWN